MENPVLLIMRGLPGSGKSHFAHNIPDFGVRLPSAKPEIASADDWFLLNNGGKFDHTQLGAAHNDCFRRALHLMQDKKAPLVVVDNANMTRAEISPYVMLGNVLGYEVTVVHVLPPREYGGRGHVRFDVLAQRNVHGVPENTIRNMADRLETLPPYWREINI